MMGFGGLIRVGVKLDGHAAAVATVAAGAARDIPLRLLLAVCVAPVSGRVRENFDFDLLLPRRLGYQAHLW
jgi:hypothetical protein